MSADLNDPETREYAGAYEMCALLLTSPVFNKPQRAVIERQAYRMKDKLEALGVKFTEGGDAL